MHCFSTTNNYFNWHFNACSDSSVHFMKFCVNVIFTHNEGDFFIYHFMGATGFFVLASVVIFDGRLRFLPSFEMTIE